MPEDKNVHTIYSNWKPRDDVVVYIKNKKDQFDAEQSILVAMGSARGTVKAIFLEEQSPSRTSYRPELIKAVDYVNEKALRTLVIPNMDYLERNVSAIAEFMRLQHKPYIVSLSNWGKRGLQFRKLDIQTLMSVGMNHAELHAKNKCEGIARKKATGWKAGNPQLNIATLNAAKARRALADKYVKSIISKIRKIQSHDQTTLMQIASSLMAQGEKTRRGKKTWTPTGVKNILDKAKKLNL